VLQWVDWNWLEGGKRGPNQGAKNVQKKLNNLLTGPLISAIVTAHTVNTNYIKRKI
jgi:hypothetical protein